MPLHDPDLAAAGPDALSGSAWEGAESVTSWRERVQSVVAPVAMVLVALGWALALLLAHNQPWLGLKLAPAVQPDGGVVVTAVDGPAAEAEITPGLMLRALQTTAGTLPVVADDLTDRMSDFASYARWAGYEMRQQALAQALRQPEVVLLLTDHHGVDIQISLRPSPQRPLATLPLAFWVQLLAGAVVVLVSGWTLRRQPLSAATGCLGLMGAALLLACSTGAVYNNSARELALPAGLLHALALSNHTGATLFVGGVMGLLACYPRPVLHRAAWATGAALYLLWHLAHMLWLLPAPWVGQMLQLPVGLALAGLLGAWQWRASAGQATDRAALRWLLLSLAAGVGFFMGVYMLPPLWGWPPVSQAVIYVVTAAAHVSLALGVWRSRLHDIDLWSTRLPMWLLGMAVIVLIDLVVIGLLPVSDRTAMLISLLVFAGLYLPLRQGLWGWMLSHREPSLLAVASEILALGIVPPIERLTHWRRLLRELFDASRIEVADLSQIDPPPRPGRVELLGGGMGLCLPPLAGLPPMVLWHRDRGRRLFATADRRLAQRLCNLVANVMQTREAYGRGAAEERLRIADDLHDDLGAKLLALAHVSGTPGKAEQTAALARQALEEMRLAVRNLKAQPAQAADLLADWRAETVDRLASAGIGADWQAEAPAEPLLLPAHSSVQLTRVLREAVSNLIRHSGAAHCAVRITVSRDQLTMEIEDDGCGLPPETRAAATGHGLANIERRVRRLGGTHRFSSGALGGALLTVQVPFDAKPMSPQHIYEKT